MEMSKWIGKRNTLEEKEKRMVIDSAQHRCTLALSKGLPSYRDIRDRPQRRPPLPTSNGTRLQIISSNLATNKDTQTCNVRPWPEPPSSLWVAAGG